MAKSRKKELAPYAPSVYLSLIGSDEGNELGDEQMTREQRKIKNGNVKRNKIRKSLRLAIYLRDNMTCVYCKRNLRGSAPAELSVDHINCRSHGGKDTADNLVLACTSCNSKRQNKTLVQFADDNTRRRVYRRIRKDIAPYRDLARDFLGLKTLKKKAD
jgi:CRISPR/Cas system Type II protein with McrA/HNH and RuvC-like nuclease domain